MPHILSDRITQRRILNTATKFAVVSVGVAASLLISGCEPKEISERIKSRIAASDEMSGMVEEAKSIETTLSASQVPNSPRTKTLCAKIEAGITPQQWLMLAQDAGGRTSRLIEDRTVLNEWSKMRCKPRV